MMGRHGNAKKSDDGLPTDTASATCAFGLRVVLDGKLRADEFGDIVNSAAADERQANAVDQNGDTQVHFELTARCNSSKQRADVGRDEVEKNKADRESREERDSVSRYSQEVMEESWLALTNHRPRSLR